MNQGNDSLKTFIKNVIILQFFFCFLHNNIVQLQRFIKNNNNSAAFVNNLTGFFDKGY
jgi:hypothetical protein